MLLQKSYTSPLQEAYLEDNNGVDKELMNEWDLFLYESQVEHLKNVQTRPLTSYLYNMLDYTVLENKGDEHNYSLLKELMIGGGLYLLLTNNLPFHTTINQNLYNYINHEITYPTFYQAFNKFEVPLDYYTRSTIENNAKEYAINESKFQQSYLEHCITYIKNQDITIDSRQYLKQIRKNPMIARSTCISNALKSGSLTGGIRRPRMNMKLTVTDMVQHMKNVAEYEAVTYANARAVILGKNEIYKTKTWVWSHKAHTRHSNMSGNTVPVNDPFYVVNEKTGEACNLMFPRDYARDLSGANTVNCGCSVKYNRS